MDIKFVILLVVALAIVFLIMSEINALRTDIDKKFNEFDSLVEKNNENIKTVMKKEMSTANIKFKSYTNEMLQQIRQMNKIEQQSVLMMSDPDHFVEVDEDNRQQIPYLSEVPNLPVQCNTANNKNNCNNLNGCEVAHESYPYMSDTDKDSKFKVKDNLNNTLDSVKPTNKQPNVLQSDKRQKNNAPRGTMRIDNKHTIIITDSKKQAPTKVPKKANQTKNSKRAKTHDEDDEKIEDLAQNNKSDGKSNKIIKTNCNQNDNLVQQKDVGQIAQQPARCDHTITTVPTNCLVNGSIDVQGEQIKAKCTEDIDPDNANKSSVPLCTQEGDQQDQEDQEDDDQDDQDDEQDDEQDDDQDDEEEDEESDGSSGSADCDEHAVVAKEVETDSDGSDGKNALPDGGKNNIGKKLKQLKKIQASTNSDSMSSQEITIGSGKKGGSIVVKSGKREKKETIVDDLSMGTVDETESKKTKKLKSVASYSKTELEELAKSHNLKIPTNSKKQEIFNAIKMALDGKK
jgi:hypothetical protein